MKLVCVLTAAGLSRRFGADKLACPIEGVPMGIRSMALYEELPFSARILVTCAARPYLMEAGERHGWQTLLNEHPEAGMSGSVILGTRAAMAAGAEGILFAVGDQPYLQKNSVLSLIRAFEKEPEQIWALGCGGRSGKPSVFPKSCFQELLKLTGDRGGKPVMLAHPELVSLLETPERELTDLDVPLF